MSSQCSSCRSYGCARATQRSRSAFFSFIRLRPRSACRPILVFCAHCHQQRNAQIPAIAAFQTGIFSLVRLFENRDICYTIYRETLLRLGWTKSHHSEMQGFWINVRLTQSQLLSQLVYDPYSFLPAGRVWRSFIMMLSFFHYTQTRNRHTGFRLDGLIYILDNNLGLERESGRFMTTP